LMKAPPSSNAAINHRSRGPRRDCSPTRAWPLITISGLRVWQAGFCAATCPLHQTTSSCRIARLPILDRLKGHFSDWRRGLHVLTAPHSAVLRALSGGLRLRLTLPSHSHIQRLLCVFEAPLRVDPLLLQQRCFVLSRLLAIAGDNHVPHERLPPSGQG